MLVTNWGGLVLIALAVMVGYCLQLSKSKGTGGIEAAVERNIEQMGLRKEIEDLMAAVAAKDGVLDSYRTRVADYNKQVSELKAELDKLKHRDYYTPPLTSMNWRDVPTTNMDAIANERLVLIQRVTDLKRENEQLKAQVSRLI